MIIHDRQVYINVFVDLLFISSVNKTPKIKSPPYNTKRKSFFKNNEFLPTKRGDLSI